MARYAVNGQSTNTASTTVLAIDGTTTSRGAIYDLLLGSDATPADNAAQWNLKRFGTANGTGTAVVPQPLDAADGVARLQGTQDHSVEPTYTTTALMEWGQNQRATFRWVAAPGGELIIPATSDAGIGLISQVATSAVNMNATFHYSE